MIANASAQTAIKMEYPSLPLGYSIMINLKK